MASEAWAEPATRPYLADGRGHISDDEARSQAGAAVVAIPILVQASLAEEVVLRATGTPVVLASAFRSERDMLYEIDDRDARERAFADFHSEWFEKLGFLLPLRRALDELPILAARCARCIVTPAMTRADEGADLLVPSESDVCDGMTVLVRLRSASFESTFALLSFLRAELLHVADMIDPAFGYDPVLPSPQDGPANEHLRRDRYRTLWDLTVAGRLARRGHVEPRTRDLLYESFRASFPMLGHDAASAFERFFDVWPLSHADLVAFAVDPRGADPRPGPGSRCPLCRFPTYTLEPDALAGDVVGRIRQDFPAWQPAHGLCRQCADLYRAKRPGLRR